MEVNISAISEVLQEAEIRVTHDELQPHFDRAYEEYRPKAEVKGFRKGKVPLSMIKRLFGESIEYNSLDRVANDFYHKAMGERDIHPIGQPSMVDMDFKRGEHFRFKIKYEIKPDIELKTYKGLAVERPVHTVTDDDIEKEIVQIRRANSTHTDVQSVTDPEHIVTGDVQELDDTGAPLIGKRSTNVRFYLADEALAQEIKDALLAAETGGVYRARIESRQGESSRSMYIAVTVSNIEKVTLPDLDDVFVKKITSEKVSTTEEFLKNLRTDIQQYWDEQAERHVSEAIVSELVRKHDFPVPDTLINTVLDALIDDVKSRTRDRQLPRDFDEQKFRTDNRSYAIRQAKWILLREKIAGAENVTVTDEEIDQIAEGDAVKTGIAKDRLLDYYKKSSGILDRMLSDKIMSFLKRHAVITETVMKV